jgi:hypothetical protein
MSSKEDYERKMAFAAKLDRLINESPKSQAEIARDMEYEKQNIITMFKSGQTRVPLNKIVPLARSLGYDPAELIQDWFKTYLPDALGDIETYMGMIVGAAEKSWIMNLRKLFPERVPFFDSKVGDLIKEAYGNQK